LSRSAIKVVEDFYYLASYIYHSEKDIKVRIGKASVVVVKMKRIWKSKHIS